MYAAAEHLEKAKELLKKGDLDSLRYACLEVRFCLEAVCYEKLRLRLNSASLSDLRGWQPHRVIETLRDLVDSAIEKPTGVTIAEDGPDGTPGEFGFLGETKPVKAKWAGEHWNKISSYLHVRLPKGKNDTSFASIEPEKLRLYLEEVVRGIEEAASGGFDFHFAMDVAFTCGGCGDQVIRSENSLKAGSVVVCGKPGCRHEYVVEVSGEDFSFTPHTYSYKCDSCAERMEFHAHWVNELKRHEAIRFKCNACGEAYQVQWMPRITREWEVALLGPTSSSASVE